MIPTNSSGTTNGCDNISSNCVVWQGPDIACIDLCSGDTISDVTFKLATKVCDLITNGVASNPVLTGLDLKCLNIPGITPTALVPVLQAMVVQICTNSGSQATPNSSSNLKSTKQVQNDLPIMTLPACMQYNDSAGNPVTQLRLDLFATLIATQVCTNLSSISVINSTLTSYSSRLDILEACVLPCSGVVAEKQVIPTCIINVGQLTDVSVLLLALEVRFCALETAVGLPAAINLAIGQPTIQGSTTTLTTPSVSYSGLSGWNNSPNTMAQSVQNTWVVIDDIYTAIASIQTNCCPTGCDNITFAYTTTNILNTGNGLIDGLTFDFTGSSIPNTFNDSSGFSKISVTDGDGLAVNTTVSVSTLQTNPSGFVFNLPTLNTASGLSVSVNFGVTDGVSTCRDDQSSVVTGIINCPNVTMGSIQSSAVTVSFVNVLGATAVYVIDILDAAGTAVQATYTQNNPTANVAHTFSGLVANTIYQTRVTIQYGGITKVCDLIQWQTSSGVAPCTDGMDVAFVIDYTGSMQNIIDNVKAGVAGIVSTIDTASGASNYRLGLVTADESYTTSFNYDACVDYTGLPAGQKVINTGSGTTLTYQIITAWEMFQDNNGATFSSQLAKLAGGVVGSTCVNLGNGAQPHEPCDYAAQLITGGANFVNTFRPNVAKYIIIITDNLPGGTQDSFNATTYAGIQQMIVDGNNNGIKYFVLGAGTAMFRNIGGINRYPWRDLAQTTGGAYNISADATVISNLITAGCS